MSTRRPKFRQPFANHGNQGSYGHLVGRFETLITAQFGNPHARVVLTAAGARYEVDINVFSTRPTPDHPKGSDVEFAIRDEAISAIPDEGVDDTQTLAYASLELGQGDFTSVDADTLHDKLSDLANSADLIEVFGVIYHDANGTNGIHDVHMNSGEAGEPPADARSKDGAIAFYSIPHAGHAGDAHAQWVFIKFATQTLP